MSDIHWATSWDCNDCGHQEPITPRQDVRPVEAAHTCDPDQRRTYAERRALWWEGYQFACNNAHDELVKADITNYGTGWARYATTNTITITCPEDDE